MASAADRSLAAFVSACFASNSLRRRARVCAWLELDSADDDERCDVGPSFSALLEQAEPILLSMARGDVERLRLLGAAGCSTAATSAAVMSTEAPTRLASTASAIR